MASYTNLNIPRIGDQMLQGFVKQLAVLAAFSTRYEPTPSGKNQGNTILVPLVGSLSATTYNGSYAISGGTMSVVTVTIDKHHVVHIGQNDLDAMNNSEAKLDNYFFQAGAALGQRVVEDVLTLVTTSNFASVTAVASTALDLPQLRAARLALNQANVRGLARFGLIDCVGYDALLGVTNFIQAYASADGGAAQREGSVGRKLGFDLYELNSMFTSANSVNAFLGQASAIAIAMRYVAPQKPEAYDMAQMFTDPASGATFGLRSIYDPLTALDYMAIECNWGKSVGLTQAARIIKRTD